MKKSFFFAALLALLMTACSQKPRPTENHDTDSIYGQQPGDSTRYGLACDGCTDSVLVLLPYTTHELDTFDIIDAFQEHRIYGRPNIGDDLAVIVNPDSTSQALMVINLSKLKEQWCYQVTPTWNRQPSDRPVRPIPDSIRQRFMAPREYGMHLKNGGIVMSSGAYHQQSNEAMSPVKYPPVKRYASWKFFNGRLILIPDTASHQEPDTAVIELLRRDSLVLRFRDHVQSYYRKKTL